MSTGREYYLSPSGNDNSDGLAPGEAWATFEKAWTVLQPGDTLTLLDGVYYQSLAPTKFGVPGMPITIRAQNDGKAIIDGQGVRIPVHLKGWQTGYVIIEGIVAKNSSAGVFYLEGSNNNILRRVSGYDANTDTNSHVITVWGDNNLVEDCVAAGTGRKMIVVYLGENNVIRRCLADWEQWDGREWHDCWPWGEGIEIYNGSNNIIENSIAYGNTPNGAVSLLSQNREASNNNMILGTMAILGGMKHDGTPMVWGDTRPQPTEYTCVAKVYEWPQHFSGFAVTSNTGIHHNNLLQDILAWGNGRYGLSFYDLSGDNANNRVNRATVFNNGLIEANYAWGPLGTGALNSELALFSSIENSSIENIWTGSTFTSMNGEGARLTTRYVDGVLTDQPLWPWPMEERVQKELDYSITAVMTNIISQIP
jgi:hypothetical protein